METRQRRHGIHLFATLLIAAVMGAATGSWGVFAIVAFRLITLLETVPK